MYLLGLACGSGVSVFTCTEDVETLHSLQAAFPHATVLHAGDLETHLATHTAGAGVDVVITITPAGIDKFITSSVYLDLKYTQLNVSLLKSLFCYFSIERHAQKKCTFKLMHK